MSFWKNATESLNTGVQLGVRAQEREADREERRLDREQRNKQWEATNARAEAAEAREKTEFDEKQQFKLAKKSFNAARALYEAGIATGDENQQRMSAKLLSDTYNQHWVNGDEMKIIFKSDSANNPAMQVKWDEDKNLQGKEVAILSRSGGVMPFKNLDDAFKYAAAGLNMENFTAGVKAAEAKVAELNAKEEPFMGDDGQYYTRRWKMGKGGMPEKSDPIPYTGVTKASKTKQDVVETEKILGRKLKPGEVGVKTGLTKAEGASEMAKNYAQAEKARAEGKAAGEKGKAGAMDEKALKEAKASLDILLRPFVSKGKPILDPETGEMTEAADNGLKVAGKLVDKYNEDPKSLTKEERRDLPHAVRALEVFKSISASITGKYISKEQAAKMAEGEGGAVNYKDGNWHPVTNGEHKGKEARYNAETKKYEIRKRSGVTASYDNSGEPAAPAAAPGREEAPPAASAGLPPSTAQPAPGREPTAAEQNATRAGLVARVAGPREESALDRYVRSDKEVPPFEGEPAYGGGLTDMLGRPVARVMEDYEEQKRRSGR